MIKFTEGGLIDIWPEKDPEIQALSYALQQQFKKLKAYADKTQCYSDVDDLDEDILDYFAVEMRSMYYEQNLEIERKREIVKNTLKWYTYAGAPATVAEMVGVVFGSGKIVEWFDYDEPPFTPGTFDIITSARLTPDIIDQLNAMIQKAKNVRSHIRRVTIIRDVHSAMHLAAFQTAVQECTVLNIIREDKEAGQATYAATAAGTRDRDSFVLNTTSGDVQTAQTGRQGAIGIVDKARGTEVYNTLQTDAGIQAGNHLAAFGSVTDNRSCVTNEAAGNTAAHSATTVAQKGDAHNITSFIKEEKH